MPKWIIEGVTIVRKYRKICTVTADSFNEAQNKAEAIGNCDSYDFLHIQRKPESPKTERRESNV